VFLRITAPVLSFPRNTRVDVSFTGWLKSFTPLPWIASKREILLT